MKLSPVVGFFILVVCAVSAEQGHQEVKPGQNVYLQCLGPEGAAVIIFLWRRTDLQPVRYLLFYRENSFYEHYQHESFRGRVEEIRSSSMKDGDFSVSLQNVSIEDSGTYECLIRTMNPGGGDSELRRSVNLTVSDKEQAEEGGNEQENLGVRGQEDKGDGGKEENPTVVKLLLGICISTTIFLYCIFC